MGKYKDMVVQARLAGTTSEETMWNSIDDVDELLSKMKEYDEEAYWSFLRKAHETMHGCHYDETFAKWDVSNMFHTNASGEKITGHHWTVDEVTNAYQGKSFPASTTEYDKWVGANAVWHDLSNTFDDSTILEIAYQFFFKDEDAPDGKIWIYESAM